MHPKILPLFPALVVALACGITPAFAQGTQNFNRDDAVEETALDEMPGAPTPLTPPASLQPPAPAPHAVPVQATDLQLRMNALENLVRGLTGQVEKLQFSNNQLMQQTQKMGADNELRFQQAEQRLAQQEGATKALASTQQQMQQATVTPPATATAPTQPAAASATTVPTTAVPTSSPAPAAETKPAVDAPKPAEKPAETSAPEKKTEAGEKTLGTISGDGKKGDATAQADYDAAFAFMRQAKYDDAEKAFDTFLKTHAKSRLIENATYWHAETFYARSKFAEAAVAFAEGYEKFPKGAKAPDNLLKLAMALGALNKKQDACLTLSELTKNFPKASAVTQNRAAQEKKNLGCN